MWRHLVVGCGLVIAGCEAGATKPDCTDAARGVVKAAGSGAGSNAAAAQASIAKRCADDKWTAAATTCMRDATSADAQAQCRHKHLTGEQADTLDELLGSLFVDTEFESALATMATFRDKMCACKDAVCAKRVSEEMTQWGQDMARKTTRPPRMSDAQQQRATEIGTAMGECMVSAMGATGVSAADDDTATLAVTAVEPNVGDSEGGTYVRIRGKGFATVVRAANVYFGAKQGIVIRFASDTELIVEAPGGTPGETVDVRVVFEPGGEQTIPSSFRFVDKS